MRNFFKIFTPVVRFFLPPNQLIGTIFEDSRPRLSEITEKKSGTDIRDGDLLLLSPWSTGLSRNEHAVVKIYFVACGTLGIYFEAEVVAVLKIEQHWTTYEETKQFVHAVGPEHEIVKSYGQHPKLKRINQVFSRWERVTFLTIEPEILSKKIEVAVLSLRHFYNKHSNRLYPDLVSF